MPAAQRAWQVLLDDFVGAVSTEGVVAGHDHVHSLDRLQANPARVHARMRVNATRPTTCGPWWRIFVGELLHIRHLVAQDPIIVKSLAFFFLRGSSS